MSGVGIAAHPISTTTTPIAGSTPRVVECLSLVWVKAGSREVGHLLGWKMEDDTDGLPGCVVFLGCLRL